MTHNEIRTVKHLVEIARDILRAEPGWAVANFDAFKLVMLRNRPKGAQYEMSDKQFDRCLLAAWMEVRR